VDADLASIAAQRLVDRLAIMPVYADSPGFLHRSGARMSFRGRRV
jgi:hypothetical protein